MLKRKLRTSALYWHSIYDVSTRWRSAEKAIAGGIGGIIYFLAGCCILPFGLAKASRCWSKSMSGFGRVVAFFNIQLIGYGGK